MGQCIYYKLKRASLDNVPSQVSPQGICKVIKVYDADTCTCAIYSSTKIVRVPIRLIGIDAPELKRQKKNPLSLLEKKAAMRSRAKLLSLVTTKEVPLDFTGKSDFLCQISRKLLRLESKGYDKYGRVLGRLYDGDICLNDVLLEKKWVRMYDGKTRKNWSKKDLNNILKLV